MEEAVIARGPRIPPVVFFLLAIVLALVLNRYAPLAALIPPAWRPLGWLPIAAGLAIAGVGMAQFARRKTTLHTDQRPAALITDGVFAFSRNPGYLALLLVLGGEALLLGSLSPWLAPLLMAPLMHFYYIPSEEAILTGSFGADYEAYRRRVRRWL